MTNNSTKRKWNIITIVGCVLGEILLLSGVIAAYMYLDIDLDYDFLSPFSWLIIIGYILAHGLTYRLLVKNNIITTQDSSILRKIGNIFGYAIKFMFFASMSFLFVMGKVESLILAGVIAVIMGILCIPIWRKISKMLGLYI